MATGKDNLLQKWPNNTINGYAQVMHSCKHTHTHMHARSYIFSPSFKAMVAMVYCDVLANTLHFNNLCPYHLIVF